MRIYLGKIAGFCMGVSRAISKAQSLSREKGVIYTYGPLIHNPQVIEDLRRKNIRVAKSPRGARGATLMIRTHGISPQEKALIKESEAIICDMTCPRVSKVQRIINKYARLLYKVVIIGDSNHPEVKALLGYSIGRGYVVSKEKDIGKLPRRSKICVVSQTTMSSNIFEKLSRKLQEKFKELIVFNTICDSTSKRQNEVLELCKKVEAMIVIGGKNSANTTRLAEISRSAGVKAYHIETEDELDLGEIKRYKAVGVTAGASTPNWMIKRVVERLKTVNSPKL